MTKERMSRLEEQVAFQEDTIQKLDNALAHQQQQLMAAERKIELLMQQLQKIEVSQPQSMSDEKPPHY
ncbi:MAG TPA: SlyX protein [Gammaproteobacteria bacterium]|nr:SlyX protein [Gammaproteobacteria bacterium]|tara:strand:- start:256 stop:459 length:204 start_codon:yes stop_codon:yes gene_type:complete